MTEEYDYDRKPPKPLKRERRVVAKIWLDNGSEMGFEDHMTYFIAKAFYEKQGRVKHAAKNNDGPDWDQWTEEKQSNSSEQSS